MMAMPELMTMLVRYNCQALDEAARDAAPIAVITRPLSNVLRTPKRAMSVDPGVAAIANKMTGMPDSSPTSVPDRCNSCWMIEMTGGTARTVSRRLTPHAHNRNNGVHELLLFFIAGDIGSSGVATQADV